MRILAITNLYPRPGHETFAAFNRQQFGALARSHDLKVVAPVLWPEALRDRFSRHGLSRCYTNCGGIEVFHPIYYYTPKTLRHRYGRFYYSSVRNTVMRVLAGFEADVVLSCYAHPDGWASIRFGRQARLPVVVKVIGTDVLTYGKHARRKPLVAEALCQADGVAAVSHDLAEHVLNLGVDPRRVFVVPEGLDAALFSPGDRAAARARLGLTTDVPIVLFVGGLLETKGASVLVEACATLRDHDIPFRCYLVGQGRDGGKLKRRIVEVGLGSHVFLPVSCAHARLADWYLACDVMTLPSFSEGIPNVLREAIACGRPFVATRVGGIPEIAHPSYSRLVPPRDVGALADALKDVLSAPPIVDPSLVAECNVTCERSAELLAECLARAVRSHAAAPDGARRRPQERALK